MSELQELSSGKAPPGGRRINLINSRHLNQTAPTGEFEGAGPLDAAEPHAQVKGIANDAFDADVPHPASVRVIRAGNVIEIFASDRYPYKGGRRRDDDDLGVARVGGSWVDLSTGEIVRGGDDGEEKGGDRTMSPRSWRQSQAALRRLINANVYDPSRVIWITLTYDQARYGVVRDPAVVQADLQEYHRRQRRWARGLGYELEYIDVLEPQRSGAWHVHEVLICTTGKMPYIDNNGQTARWWARGFTSTRAVRDIDNLGAYLSAYLGDAEVDVAGGEVARGRTVDVELVNPETGKRERKKFLKGGRIHYYPRGMNMYRCSRGIERPSVTYLNCYELEELLGRLGDPDYRASKELTVSDNGTSFTKKMSYWQYNMARDHGTISARRSDNTGDVHEIEDVQAVGRGHRPAGIHSSEEVDNAGGRNTLRVTSGCGRNTHPGAVGRRRGACDGGGAGGADGAACRQGRADCDSRQGARVSAGDRQGGPGAARAGDGRPRIGGAEGVPPLAVAVGARVSADATR